ncbi:S1 RNA-binding domain-containing protein [Mordavella massiliensis]|uniref:S1 RNA-binding domain-containing protein n=1 Tax=Mordavella massiliensis TaxID=1871024 RepID=A0A939BH96_9CLOT|nr:S1-like domain-containing RNA-binding protein [Mordavella massiliensis]MBM6948759.1 S1 RNA-binding domain-containing protein [Mordavella massiliensis]
MLEEKLGRNVTLEIVKTTDFGVYLGTKEDKVLLPARQVPEGAGIGDAVDVFLYRDSKDRIIATTHVPKIRMGEVKALKVKDTGAIGAFLDWGLEKDLFLPFKQQTARVKPGDECLVGLYTDKSGRLCATMKVYDRLEKNSPYKKDDRVQGIIYEKSLNFGLFVAVDDRYCALIPRREASGRYKVGDRISARVTDVKPDGKLDLSVREKAFIQMDADAQAVMDKLLENGGELPFTDKADPELIRAQFGFGKNAFKRAVGRLLKEGKIEIREKSIAIK